MSVKTHTFSTGRFRITFAHVDGYCDAPEFNDDHNREIVISDDLTGLDLLETVIHESMHAEHPQMTEKRVHVSSHNIARLLWRLGYRRRKDG